MYMTANREVMSKRPTQKFIFKRYALKTVDKSIWQTHNQVTPNSKF